MAEVRHFLDLDNFDAATLRGILHAGRSMKDARAGQPRGAEDQNTPLNGNILAMIFEKPSTRTRVSFDVGMRQLGGETIVLAANDLQLGRGETIADTAQVFSRFVDAIMIRSTDHNKVAELAECATVPVINGLTDLSHPCQIMADVMTVEEHKGPIGNKVVAWSGDCNNVANSWIHAAAVLGFELRLGCPDVLGPKEALLDWAQGINPEIVHIVDPAQAVKGADVVVTDVWESMGAENTANLHNLLRGYQVDDKLMSNAKPDAVFMHCLPARRGEEVTADVIDGPQSVVFDEAENRLHAQKAILTWCMGAA
ncbi:MAG: ornithine carbamoyltransferase [Hyphomicrobiales bacterium]